MNIFTPFVHAVKMFGGESYPSATSVIPVLEEVYIYIIIKFQPSPKSTNSLNLDNCVLRTFWLNFLFLFILPLIISGGGDLFYH